MKEEAITSSMLKFIFHFPIEELSIYDIAG